MIPHHLKRWQKNRRLIDDHCIYKLNLNGFNIWRVSYNHLRLYKYLVIMCQRPSGRRRCRRDGTGRLYGHQRLSESPLARRPTPQRRRLFERKRDREKKKPLFVSFVCWLVNFSPPYYTKEWDNIDFFYSLNVPYYYYYFINVDIIQNFKRKIINTSITMI